MTSKNSSRFLLSLMIALGALSFGAAVAQAQTETYLFNQYTLPYQSTPNIPYAIAFASGDFNHDGRTDFALPIIGGTFPYGVQIILGQKDGTLALGGFYTVNGGADQLENIVSGDFNGDGKLDLVAFDITASNYVIFLGNGDGTFQPASVIATGNFETALVTADLNRDGKLDLVTGEFSNGIIQVILGNGDGTFQPPVQYQVTGNIITSIAVADLNKDGNPDVVAIPSGGCPQVLLGNGDGTLQAPFQLVPHFSAYSVAIGDINGDGNPDIVVGEAGSIDVFLGNGDGTFGSPIQTGGNGGYYLTNLVLADLNGDRKLDVVGAGVYSLTVWLGKGDGTFKTPARTFAGGYFNGQGLNALLSGDFNNDGKVDLAVPTSAGTLVSLYSGNGDGTFAAGQVITGAVGSVYKGTVSDDFNGDGKADFVAVNSATGKVEVYLGKGTGGFQTVKRYATGSSPQQVVAGDFNGDGKLDLAVTNQGENTVSVLLGNGDGTFQAQKKFSTGMSPYGIATADLNGDGKLDLVVGTDDNPDVQVLLGIGDGTFQAATTWGDYAGTNTTVAIADINNDGKLDIAATTGSPFGMFDVLYGNGDGTFQPAVDTVIGGGENSIVALPLQPGGLVDVIIGEPGFVVVVPSNAIGGIHVGSSYQIGACTGTALVAGDFNGDGFPDVAVACEAGSSVFLGKGDGTFGTVFNYATSYFPDYSYGIAAADFNSDGALDLVVTHSGSGTIATILSNPVVVFSTARLNFGTVKVGSTATKNLTLTNQSNIKLTVTSITITGAASGDYSEINTCGSALAAGAVCTVTVTFKPTVTGTRSASVTFTDSAVGPARKVALQGVGQ
ncbi:MAG TPA: FG-GAP-like repeat-containing protein [Terriglobia bacterium]|nr:FG-GAP-like repeat-containing protein [Terriglobia bacterium]